MCILKGLPYVWVRVNLVQRKAGGGQGGQSGLVHVVSAPLLEGLETQVSHAGRQTPANDQATIKPLATGPQVSVSDG